MLMMMRGAVSFPCDLSMVAGKAHDAYLRLVIID